MLIERQEVHFETEGLSSQLVAFESTFPGVPPVAVQEAIFRRPRLHQKLRYIVVSVRNLVRYHLRRPPPSEQPGPRGALVLHPLAPVALKDAPSDLNPSGAREGADAGGSCLP